MSGTAAGGRIPDFFIVGHAKCGTTALYETLRGHPEIFMPDVKEPMFFAREARHPEGAPRLEQTGRRTETLAQYLSLFASAGADQRVGEASTFYLWSAAAPARIARANAGAKIIAIFREPASFLRSLHLQAVQNRAETETDLRKALALETKRREGHSIPRNGHWPRALLYTERVRYAEQLRRFHDAFPPEQVLVLIYDHFKVDNDATVRRVLRYLDVDDSVLLAVPKANPTVGLRSRTDRAMRSIRVGRERGPGILALPARRWTGCPRIPMYVTLDDFRTAVGRLGELRGEGLLKVGVSVSGQVSFTIDKGAREVPPGGDGLYMDIFEALSAIARGVSAEEFARARETDQIEPDSVSREKYAAAEAVFPPSVLRPERRALRRARARRLLAAALIATGRGIGRLGLCMSLPAFRRIIGPEGRHAAWCALGAHIDATAYISAGVWIRNPNQLTVGPGTQLAGHCMIESYGPVTIGRNVIMNDTDVYTTQHDIDDPGFKGERHFVTVGDYAWLPRKIILLPGVTVGRYAVIGTGSVVKTDIPDYGVAVGNPAQVIKERARIPYTYVPTRLHRPPMIR